MANKLYLAEETALKFADADQSPDVQITLANLAAAAARISNQHDLGAASRAADYEVRATFQFATAPVVGQSVDIWIATSNGINIDGEPGASDAAFTVAHLKNLAYVGSVIVTSTDLNHDMTASFEIWIATRYFSLVVDNNTADNLRNDTGVNTIMVTPIPPEVQ